MTRHTQTITLDPITASKLQQVMQLQQRGAVLAAKDALATMQQEGHWHPQFDTMYSQLQQQVTAIAQRVDVLQGKLSSQAAPEIFLELGNLLLALMRQDEVLACLKQAVALYPTHVDILFNLGNLLRGQGRFQEAVDCYNKVLKQQAQYKGALTNIAICYWQLEQYDQAVEAYGKVIALDPSDSGGLYNYATALKFVGSYKEALDYFDRCLQLVPNHIDAMINKAVCWIRIEQFDDATTLLRQVLTLQPGHANAHYNLADALNKSGEIQEAAKHYQLSIDIDPMNHRAYYALGIQSMDQGEREQGLELLRKSLKVEPDYLQALAALSHQLQHVCLWDEYAKVEATLKEVLPQHDKLPLNFHFYSVVTFDDDAFNFEIAKATHRQMVEDLKCFDLPEFNISPSNYTDDKITIGYISNRLNNTATGHNMTAVFEHHDHERFNIHAYSFGGDDKSEHRKVIRGASDRFVDISELSDRQAAEQIHADKVQVLIDLKGFTQGCRYPIMAAKPAPIQMLLIGLPGTSGAPFYDYFVADGTALPSENTKCFSENILYMPYSYFPANRNQTICDDNRLSRSDYGLPKEGVIFASFNHAMKITKVMFVTWLELLQEVPGSVLWIIESNQEALANLHGFAKDFGVDPARIIGSVEIPKDQHLARLALADIALDSYPCPGHTTTLDALCVNVPVVTLQGSHFCSRASDGMLKAAGLETYICSDMKAYKQKALELARSPEELAKLKLRLKELLPESALFDAAVYTKSLEQGIEQIWSAYQNDPQSLPAVVKAAS